VPGMTCVNGNWIPAGTTIGSPCPGGPIPGMTCVNGDWIPVSSKLELAPAEQLARAQAAEPVLRTMMAARPQNDPTRRLSASA